MRITVKELRQQIREAALMRPFRDPRDERLLGARIVQITPSEAEERFPTEFRALLEELESTGRKIDQNSVLFVLDGDRLCYEDDSEYDPMHWASDLQEWEYEDEGKIFVD